MSRSATSTFCCCSSCFHVFGQFIARLTHTHTQLESHMETAWKAGRIFREHFQQTASGPLDFFSTSRACFSQIQLYVTPAKLAACVCTPDTHTDEHTLTHTTKTHSLLCPACHLVDILSAPDFQFARLCDKINKQYKTINISQLSGQKEIARWMNRY